MLPWSPPRRRRPGPGSLRGIQAEPQAEAWHRDAGRSSCLPVPGPPAAILTGCEPPGRSRWVSDEECHGRVDRHGRRRRRTIRVGISSGRLLAVRPAGGPPASPGRCQAWQHGEMATWHLHRSAPESHESCRHAAAAGGGQPLTVSLARFERRPVNLQVEPGTSKQHLPVPAAQPSGVMARPVSVWNPP